MAPAGALRRSGLAAQAGLRASVSWPGFCTTKEEKSISATKAHACHFYQFAFGRALTLSSRSLVCVAIVRSSCTYVDTVSADHCKRLASFALFKAACLRVHHLPISTGHTTTAIHRQQACIVILIAYEYE